MQVRICLSILGRGRPRLPSYFEPLLGSLKKSINQKGAKNSATKLKITRLQRKQTNGLFHDTHTHTHTHTQGERESHLNIFLLQCVVLTLK